MFTEIENLIAKQKAARKLRLMYQHVQELHPEARPSDVTQVVEDIIDYEIDQQFQIRRTVSIDQLDLHHYAWRNNLFGNPDAWPILSRCEQLRLRLHE